MTYTAKTVEQLRNERGTQDLKLSRELGLIADAFYPLDVPTGRTATFVIAANDSSTLSKEQADYVCDGVEDDVQIQAAIDALPSCGGNIFLFEGTYLKENTAGISITSNTKIQLSDSAIIKFVDGINANACVFTNSDTINGNTSIIICGGILEGNEENQTNGSMYGIDFTKVTNSKIDMWIKGFRSYDIKSNDCSGLIVENRWFGKKWNKSECIYDGMHTITGNGSLTITIDPPIDLRNKRITFVTDHPTMILEFTPVDGAEFTHSAFTDSGLPPITGYSDSEFLKMYYVHNSTSETVSNNDKLKSINQLRFHFWTGTSYQIGQVWVEPLPDKPIISINFDDGGEEFYNDFAPILLKYGYKGIVAKQSGYGDNTTPIQALHENYDWDIVSHTETHPHLTTITNELACNEYIKSKQWLENNNMSRASFIFVAPYHEINYEKYNLALDTYRDIRGLSRYNQGFNLKTDWVQNYIVTDSESVFRSKRTHSWEHKVFHSNSSTTDIETFCQLIKEYGIGVVTFTNIYGSYKKENWHRSSRIISSGSATIANGTTSIDVSHNLSVTPTVGDISVTPIEAWGNMTQYYIDTYTSTQFTIHADINPGQDVDFAWKAMIL